MKRDLAASARTAERLGVLGGSFDPVHVGHVHVAERAIERFDLDHVVWVPAAVPPHKLGRRLAAAEHRLAMLELALTETEHPERHSIWTAELEREGPSYTVETLRALRELRPTGELFCLLGSDNVPGLVDWREVERVFELARPVIVARSGVERGVLDDLALPEELRDRLRSGWIDAPVVPASSTRVRADVHSEFELDLAPRVREYVARHGLYGGSPDA